MLPVFPLSELKISKNEEPEGAAAWPRRSDTIDGFSELGL
jgi:hypothetical protein